MIPSLFRRRTSARHTSPQAHPVTVPVNVTAAERDRPVIDHGQGDALDFVLTEGWRAVAWHGAEAIEAQRHARNARDAERDMDGDAA